MNQSEFPVKIEMYFTLLDNGKYFLAGQRFDAVGVIYKKFDCDKHCFEFRKEVTGQIVPYYIVFVNEVKYEIPVLAASIVYDEKDPEKQYRLKYIIDSAEGELGIRDHVKAAKDYLGIDIRYRGVEVSGEWRKYFKVNEKQALKPKITENLEDQINAQVTSNVYSKSTAELPSVYISIISAIIHRGNTVEYGIALNIPPTETAIITIDSTNEKLSITPDVIVFNASDYNIEKEIAVTVQGSNIDEDETAKITHSITGGNYDGISIDFVSILLKADQ